MKREQFEIRPYADPRRPNLKFCVHSTLAGKRSRRFFETEAEAKTFRNLKRSELDQCGAEGTRVPAWLRFMAQRCHDELAPFGKNLDDATKHYIAFLNEQKKSCAPAKLFAEVEAEKRTAGFSAQYVNSLRRLGEKFAAWIGEKTVAEITARDIDDYLTELKLGSAVSRNHFRILFNVAFEHAKKRGYCPKNPVADTIIVKQVPKPVGILTPDELARLLAAASPETLPALAISAFAGLRTAEVSKLDWKQINLDGEFIEVTAANAKSSRRRIVKILPCLDAWLRPFERKEGPVIDCQQVNLCVLRKKDCERAGLQEWPKNALRHSFASYHIAFFKDAAALALEMGHKGTDLIFAHYREVVHSSKGAEYFNITPGSRKETAVVRAFKPDSYRWSLHVFGCADEWLSGPTELSRYFGVSVQAPRYWFKNPKAPALREDGQFHVATWRAFITEHTRSGPKNQRGIEKPFFTALGEEGLCAREQRVYFATRDEAQAYADRENTARLAKAIRLPAPANVVPFSGAATATRAARAAV